MMPAWYQHAYLVALLHSVGDVGSPSELKHRELATNIHGVISSRLVPTHTFLRREVFSVSINIYMRVRDYASMIV